MMADIKDRAKERMDAMADKGRDYAERGAAGAQHAAESAGGMMHTAMDKAKDIAGSAKEMAGTAVDKAKDVAGAAKDMAGTAVDKAKEWAGSAADGLSHAKDAVKDFASEAYEKSADMAQHMSTEVTSFVRRYPIPSLLAGLGIGFLLGRALRSSA